MTGAEYRRPKPETDMRHILRILLSALIALCLPSCQGRGRVHEAAPPRYPDSPSVPTESTESVPGWEGTDEDFPESERQAEPPAPAPGWDDQPSSSAPEARAGESRAPQAAGGRGWTGSS